MDIVLKVADIKAMLKNIGLVESSIKVYNPKTIDPENDSVIDLEFMNFIVEAEDPITGCEYEFSLSSKIRLPDGLDANSSTKLGYCIECESPISLSEQARCHKCKKLLCKEHCASEYERHYYCDKCYRPFKNSETWQNVKDFLFKKRYD